MQNFSYTLLRLSNPWFGLVGLLAALLAPGTAARADELVIPGSGNPEHVLTLLANAFNAQQTRHKVIVPPTNGTAGALRDVEAGTAVLGRVGRPLSSAELARGLVYVPLGRDPVAFVGGAGVTVTNLSQAQVIDIYSGKLSNWRELGGAPGPIRVIGRESTDSSRQTINRFIKPFADIAIGPNMKLVHLDSQMIELLDRFPASLGFLNRSALAASKTQLVLMSLDGVESSPQQVAVGRYPLWLEFGFIHKRGALAPAASAFLDFVRTPTGVRILREQGVMAAAGAH